MNGDFNVPLMKMVIHMEDTYKYIMQTKLQGLHKELKNIKARKIEVYGNYNETHKRRDLEDCLDSIEREENSISENYDNDDHDDYHQPSPLATGW